jgi:hypothetical protein
MRYSPVARRHQHRQRTLNHCAYQRGNYGPLSRQHAHQFRRSAGRPWPRGQATHWRKHVVNIKERPSYPPKPRRTRDRRRRPRCHCGGRHAHCGDRFEQSHPEALGENVPGQRQRRPSRGCRQDLVKPDGATQSRSTGNRIAAGNHIAARAAAGQESAWLAPPVAADQLWRAPWGPSRRRRAANDRTPALTATVRHDPGSAEHTHHAKLRVRRDENATKPARVGQRVIP